MNYIRLQLSVTGKIWAARRTRGSSNWLLPIPDAIQRIQAPYAALGAEREILFNDFDGKHRWNGLASYPLLDRVLKS